MQRLNGLVKMMRPGERRLLRHFYAADSKEEKRLRSALFELIEAGKAATDEIARKALDGARSSSAYSHLKSRLREDILNILLLQEAPKRIAQANRAAVFECWKKLAQAYVLIFRGAKQEGAHILKSAADLAERYELSAEIVLIKHVTREALYNFTDVKQLNAINTDIRKNLSVWTDVLRSEELSYIMTLPHLYENTAQTQEPGADLRTIGELKTLYEKSGTSRIGFWYYLAYIEYCTNNREFSKALTAGLDFLKLVETSPSVQSKNNLAGVNQTIGSTYIELRNFTAAIKHLTEAVGLFPIAGLNRLVCLQLLFQASMANKEYEQAMGYVKISLQHAAIGKREHLLPQWLFMQACAEFLANDVAASFKTLNKNGYIVKQPDGWNIQFRLLEMMQLIEMKDEDWLEFKLDATRKFLTRHKALDTPRVRAAVDIISNLLRKKLNFDELSEKSLRQLNSCIEEKENYQWQPAGTEMVRFDYWLQKWSGTI